jgi:hypothetical protein
MMTKTLLAFALAGGMTTAASGGSIAISDIGGGIVLNSGPMSSSVFGNGQTNWTTSSLTSAHGYLHGSGIATNGKVTFVAADTTHGLALMALIDDQMGSEGEPTLGHVGMVSVGHGANLAYVNAAGGSIDVTPNGTGSRTASGAFNWNSNGGGNGFAWANLATGNAITFRFNRIAGETLGLNDPSTFQFANWNGTGWSLVPVSPALLSFTATNDYGFSATVQTAQSVPLPAGSVMAGASLMGLAVLRRRRAR